MNEIQEAYKEWLIDQLNGDRGAGGYSELYGIMHGIPFLPIMEMDWNRNDEGLNLAKEWAETEPVENETDVDICTAMDEVHQNGFCTMLELIVVMSRRIQFELMDSEYDKDISEWANELIWNIGLGDYRNVRVLHDYDAAENAVAEVVGSVIFRQYGWDGEGGFFPLESPTRDQRYEQLITQMNDYIAENYDIC